MYRRPVDMVDRFYNPFDGSRKRSAPQPYTLKKFKNKYKKLNVERDEFGWYRLLENKTKSFEEEYDYEQEE